MAVTILWVVNLSLLEISGYEFLVFKVGSKNESMSFSFQSIAFLEFLSYFQQVVIRAIFRS